tara:strand:+ start:886 stop:1101 length:216 start_codon:yes stop_codon:yes gene_type:complete
MGTENSLDTKKIILEWLNKEEGPIKIDQKEKERIAELCIEFQYEKQNRERFGKQIEDIIQKLVKNHLDGVV